MTKKTWTNCKNSVKVFELFFLPALFMQKVKENESSLPRCSRTEDVKYNYINSI